MQKYIIEGIDNNIVSDVIYINSRKEKAIFASIKIDSGLDIEKTKNLGQAILDLSNLGFRYSNCTHDLGYYDAVEHQTMEFYTNPKISPNYNNIKLIKIK